MRYISGENSGALCKQNPDKNPLFLGSREGRSPPPAPPPPRARGSGGVSCQKARLRALAALGERESEGVPSSAQEASVSKSGGLREDTAWGSWDASRISASTEPRGRWGARQVCNRHRASRGWRSHLWESRELGLSQLSRGPLPHCGGRPPCPRDWGGAASQPEGTLTTTTPLPFASFLLRRALASQPAASASHSPHGPRSEGARLPRGLPMSPGGEIARRRQEREPGRKAGGAQPACFSPGSAVRAGCKNGQSAEAGLPLGNSCKRAPSPPPPCLPPPALWRARSSVLARYQVGAQLFAPRSRARPARLRLRSHSGKMRPSVRCVRPAEGQAPGEKGWQTTKGCGRVYPRAFSLSLPGALVLARS
uniref:Uncharacterized protein n=1 Tax=Rangifer tarandus platyrhynchus TaxID=3082113 RepID=A0ACB0E8V8_RANTA|nr:unnamed protein product [Rangifer tarandus platyrhynchus]